MNNFTYVTGASGFIGKHLMARLTNAIAVPHDDLSQIPPGAGTVFYLAAYGNLFGQNDVTEMVKANVLDPIRVALRTRGTFIFVSSSSVNLPVQTMYSRCKAATEQALLALKDSGRRIFIARPYSVTGVGEQPQHFIPTLIRSCIDHEPMTLEPESTHDFINVSDLVNGIIMLPQLDNAGVYEFGTGTTINNREVMLMVECCAGRTAICNINSTLLRPYDTDNWRCNPHSWPPGWKPTKTLEMSIQEMVKAYVDRSPEKVR